MLCLQTNSENTNTESMLLVLTLNIKICFLQSTGMHIPRNISSEQGHGNSKWNLKKTTEVVSFTNLKTKHSS